MKKKHTIITIMSAICMFVLILDVEVVFRAVQDGIDLCFKSVIPSVFPLMLVSGILTKSIIYTNTFYLTPLGRIWKLRKEESSLWLTGILSGYPIGAKVINDSCKEGAISRDTATYMLAFCSNCGPAFLFGMIGKTLDNSFAPWMLWGIHILSSILTGYIFRRKTATSTLAPISKNNKYRHIPESLRAIGNVCAWIIVFKILLEFCEKWFLWNLPPVLQIATKGFLELANGCLALKEIPLPGTRFILSSCMVSFGGLCVLMQTVSVTEHIGLGQYIPGKLFQFAVSFLASTAIQPLLYPSTMRCSVNPWLLCGAVIYLILTTTFIFARKSKKVVAFHNKMLYNASND